MSIESLCQGDKVTKQTASVTAGSMGGAVYSFTDASDGKNLDCLIQNMSRGEAKQFDGRGSHYFFNVFFSSDVGLTVNNGLKWTVRDNSPLTVPIYLRVLAYYREGRPGEGMLWIADCEQVTIRPER